MKETAGIMALGIAAVAVYLVWKAKQPGAAAKPGTPVPVNFGGLNVGDFLFGSTQAYQVQSRAEVSPVDLAISGGTVNLGNSAQVIVPADPFGMAWGLP